MTSIDLTLNDGNKIPIIGLGTYQSPPGEVAAAVEYALTEGGYRHIDCAYLYLNEAEVGQGLKKAFEKGVKREDIYITTKVWPTFHNRVEQSLDESLKNLGLNYVDLFLIHWPVTLNPNGNHPFRPTLPDGKCDHDANGSLKSFWKQMEDMKKNGKTKSIGVSNFSKKVLEGFIKDVEIVPAINQIESHILCPQLDVHDFCKSKNILIEAHTPFGSTGSPLFKNETVLKLAEKHNTTPGVILTSYHVSSGRTVLPKSVHANRIKENTTVITLPKEDIETLDNIHKNEGIKRTAKPDFDVDMGYPDWDGTREN